MYRFFLMFLISTAALLSCDENNKENKEIVTEQQAEPVVEVERTPEEIKQHQDMVNSVMVKTIVTREASSFSRALVTLEMNDLLSQAEAEYTLLAPSNEAFEVLGKGQSVLNDPERREELRTLIQGHILKGTFTTDTLVQGIRKNSKMEATTLSGDTVTFKMRGNDVVVTNAAGATAVVGKSDIMGSNGVLHIINAILQ